MNGELLSNLLTVFVYLVHHGDAVSAAVDSQRPLSGQGREQVEALAKQAVTQQVRPAVIWHSGKLRARQTALAFWRACNPLAEFAATRWMQPDDPPQLVDLLQGETRDVMLVGHMPHLDRLLRQLTQTDDEPRARWFPPKGVVAVERTETGWVERWRLENLPL